MESVGRWVEGQRAWEDSTEYAERKELVCGLASLCHEMVACMLPRVMGTGLGWSRELLGKWDMLPIDVSGWSMGRTLGSMQNVENLLIWDAILVIPDFRTVNRLMRGSLIRLNGEPQAIP